MRYPLLAAALATCCDPVLAVDVLDTIVVSATRAPEAALSTAANIHRIDREEIERSGAANLPELLRGRAGVQVRDLFGDGSNATLDMRGFGSSAGSNVLVLLDGRRLNPATDASLLYLNDIPLNQVERVEIVQGSSGVLFGNQAVGGVINIITRRPDTDDARVGVSGGDFGRKEIDGRIDRRFDNGLGLSLDARHLEADNYRDHNRMRVRNLSLEFDYETENGRLFVEHRHLDEWQQTPGALFLDELAADRRQSAPAYADDFIDTRSDVTRFGADQRLDSHWRFAGEATHRDDRRSFLQSFRTFAGPLSRQERRVTTVNPRLLASFPGMHGNTRLTLGVDWERTDYEIDAFILQRAEQDILAGYAQLVHPFAPDWELTLGARHARVENDLAHDIGGFADTDLALDDALSIGSLGITYRPQPGWRVFARADQNYRFAKLEEHTQDPAAGSFPFKPRGLDNQTGISYEAGLAYETPRTRISAQIYRLELNDEISFDATNFANINLDKTERNGLNLSLWRAVGDDVEISADWDLSDGKVTAGPYRDKRIPLVPTHQVRLSGRWSVDDHWELGGEWLYVGEQTLDSDYDNQFEKLDGYQVIDLHGSYQEGPWRVSLVLNNLLDRQYSEYGVVGADALGSGHPGCVSGVFSDSCPARNPAPERNLRLSLAYQFQ